MKKDILKDFVDSNRDAFDQASPSSDLFAKIQQQIQTAETAPKGKVVSMKYWWAAAAILLLAIGSIVFFQQKEPNAILVSKQPTHIKKPLPTKDSVIVSNAPLVAKNIAIQKKNAIKRRTKIKQHKTDEDLMAVNSNEESIWKTRLADSLSSSDRLATVLEMGKVSNLSVSDIKELANTMNKDESSNVRLAALDAMNGQKNQKAVKPLILKSVAKQNDPLVQMELLAMLSPHEVKSVKKELLEISQNPLNIDAVRDQAYVALLRSKSNF